MSRFCGACAAKERERAKKDGWRQDAPGLYSCAMPRMSNCSVCQTQAEGFKLCLGCAIEQKCCQDCQWSVKPASDPLLSEIATHRHALNSARDAADALYAQATEPFKDALAKYLADFAASEAQIQTDCEPLWEAERLAREAHQNLSHNAEEAVRSEKSTAFWDARKAREDGSSAAYQRHYERRDALIKAFPLHAQFRQAKKLLDGARERAAGLFHAAVDRSVEIAAADEARNAAVAKADERYKRALEFQDALDRMRNIS